MTPEFVLIDLENLRAEGLQRLTAPPFHVLVFVGALQPKVTVDVAEALQALGSCGRYIRAAGTGKNALDFHITFFIGRLVEQHPTASFHVVSNDKGFDPLVAYLAASGIPIVRVSTIDQVTRLVPDPAPPAPPPSEPAKYDLAALVSAGLDSVGDDEFYTLMNAPRRRGKIEALNPLTFPAYLVRYKALKAARSAPQAALAAEVAPAPENERASPTAFDMNSFFGAMLRGLDDAAFDTVMRHRRGRGLVQALVGDKHFPEQLNRYTAGKSMRKDGANTEGKDKKDPLPEAAAKIVIAQLASVPDEVFLVLMKSDGRRRRLKNALPGRPYHELMQRRSALHKNGHTPHLATALQGGILGVITH